MLKGSKCAAKCTLDKRKSAPGQAKKRMKSKPSEYQKRLREKQKAKICSGVMERQFSRYYHIASKMKGSTGENLLMLLETRLDCVLRTAGFISSIRAARQFVKHGYVKVNGNTVDIPSYRLKRGDTVELDSSLKENAMIKKFMEDSSSKVIPAWMECNKGDLTVKIIRIPSKSEMTTPVNDQFIVELYSK